MSSEVRCSEVMAPPLLSTFITGGRGDPVPADVVDGPAVAVGAVLVGEADDVGSAPALDADPALEADPVLDADPALDASVDVPADELSDGELAEEDPAGPEDASEPSSAHATGVAARAAPTPSATASAPIRPT